MKVALGSDHVGIELKTVLMEHLRQHGIEMIDVGTYNTERCDYPDFACKAANLVVTGECQRGILCCGTGVGISIAANKMHGIRCVCCSEPYSARLSRQHNDTNMLAMGSRVVGIELAKMILDAWLFEEFEGGRHENRVKKIAQIEENGGLASE